ncbi:MAG TPA: hypothetical protein VH063_12015 [Gaiellaceae bacterium]|jgi:hypothetical protein|nr:hypothetical protein [Gaiellaceae bacterium]
MPHPRLRHTHLRRNLAEAQPRRAKLRRPFTLGHGLQPYLHETDEPEIVAAYLYGALVLGLG